MKLVAIVFALTALRADAVCPCAATPANPKQVSATGKPAYVGQVPAYGWGCAAHDRGYDACKGSAKLAEGQADDWCQDKWCIVDPNNCDDKRKILMSYTANPNDYFSYEACDANFAGNGWVGRCKNCEAPLTNSFCTCGGLAGCKCKVGAVKQERATGKPAYPGMVSAYGSGCKAHDAGHDSCLTSKKTAEGQADDWCEDKFCIVDKNSCNFKAIGLTYTKNPNDYFSFETCNANFKGNGWAGRCKCEGVYSSSYCSCPTTTSAPEQASGTTSVFSAIMAPLLISALALVIRE